MFTQTSQVPPCGCCAPASPLNRTTGGNGKNLEASKAGWLHAVILNEEKQHIFLAIISGLSLVCSFFSSPDAWPFDPAWIAILLCGTPIIKDAVVGLVTRLDIKADVLVALALVAAVIIDEVFAAGEVAFIMSLGSLL
ncbi:MAG: hypothetical protein LBN33_05405, partial [Desulfovibrio sp.]|nr:hypothetical protein [Desulfovibrio sp.]